MTSSFSAGIHGFHFRPPMYWEYTMCTLYNVWSEVKTMLQKIASTRECSSATTITHWRWRAMIEPGSDKKEAKFKKILWSFKPAPTLGNLFCPLAASYYGRFAVSTAFEKWRENPKKRLAWTTKFSFSDEVTLIYPCPWASPNPS